MTQIVLYQVVFDWKFAKNQTASEWMWKAYSSIQGMAFSSEEL